jgi:hypothetical protein
MALIFPYYCYMKKLVLLGVVFMGLVGLYSCGNSEEAKVRDVVTKFRTAIQELKFEEAGSFCEPKTAEMIKSLGGMLAMLPQENKDKLQKELFEISKVEIKGDTATVFYWEGAQIDKSVEASQMKLAKIAGVWKIYMDKDGLNKEGKEGNQPEIEEGASFGPESGNMPGAPPSPSGGVRSHNGGEMGPAQLMGADGAQP